MKKFCPICLEDQTTPHGHCSQCGTRLLKVDPDDLSGLTLDEKYEIVERLAQGGMGVVYKARQVYLQRDVALKVLRSDLPRDSVATKRFLLEVRSVSSLTSSHTVTIHDFGISRDGRLYFAMELLSGESLEQRLLRGPLRWQDAVVILLQACESLAEAHAKSIWHRDIKPANVFLTRAATGGLHTKILDFGIAKSNDAPLALTIPGRGFGTPAYSSPEQVMGEVMDHRSDLYSLGIVAYEMLTGKRPFDGEGSEILMRQIRDNPAPMSSMAPQQAIPESIEAMVLWMLQKLPTRRPASAAALAHRLRQAAAEAAPGAAFPMVGEESPVEGASSTWPVADPLDESTRDVDSLAAPAVLSLSDEPSDTDGEMPVFPLGSGRRAAILFLVSFVTAFVFLAVWRPWSSPAPVSDSGLPLAPHGADVTRASDRVTGGSVTDAAHLSDLVDVTVAPRVVDLGSQRDVASPDTSGEVVWDGAPEEDGGNSLSPPDLRPSGDDLPGSQTSPQMGASGGEHDVFAPSAVAPLPERPLTPPARMPEEPPPEASKKPVTKGREYGILEDKVPATAPPLPQADGRGEQGDDDEYGLIPSGSGK